MAESLNFQALFELVSKPMLVLDRELRCVAANRAFLAQSGSPLADLLGLQASELPSLPDELDGQRLHASLAKVLATHATDVVGPLTHTPILDDDGKVAFIVQEGPLAEKPTSTPRLDRQRLLEILDQAPGFICFLRGRDHVFELVNRAYLNLVGQRDLIGRSVREAIPEAEAQGFIALLDRVLATGKPWAATAMPIMLQRQPGAPTEEAILDFVYQPIVEADGRVSGIFVEGIDRTAQARLEAESVAREKQALRDVEKAEVLLRDVFEHVPAMVGVIRAPDQRYVLANSGIRALYGHRPLLGRTRREAHPDLENQGIHELVDEVFRSGQRQLARGIKVRIDRNNDGQLRDGWYDVSYEPVKGEDGAVESVVLFAVEVTEQFLSRQIAEAQRAEASRALADREQFFQLAPELFCIAGLDGRIRRVNRAFSDVTGWSEQEFSSAPFLDFLHPDDRDATRAQFQGLHKGHDIIRFANRLRCKNGGYRWLSWTVSAVTGSDAVYAAVRDITEARRREDGLALLARTESVLSDVLDVSRTLSAVAQLAVPSFADWSFVDLYRDEGQIMERVAVAHADPAKADVAREALKYPAVQTRHPALEGFEFHRAMLEREIPESMYRAAAQSPEHERYIRAVAPRSMIGVPLVSRGRRLGALTFVVGWGRAGYDEADRELAEELGRRAALAIDNAQLFESAKADRARAEDANRAKDEFLAVVSHELRTPLTAILGYANMLRNPSTSEVIRARAAEVIERNARAQAALINDILDLLRINSGKLRLSVAPVDLHAVIEGALESVRPASDARQVEITTVLDPAVQAISGDAERLQQVLWNLLSNSIKFSSLGGKVTLELTQVHRHVEIIVTDNGHGIAPEFLPHVFERFRQGDSSSTRRHGGLGLGLAIVKHLVELHGGKVEARSAGLEKGSTFVVKLPLMAVQTGTAEPMPTLRPGSEPLPLEFPAELADLRILVVEDEPDARALVAAVLERCRATVFQTASAAEGLAALAANGFDVIVSDVGMPDEDGYSFMRKVRKLAPEHGGRLPAVALTAYATAEDRTRALLAGFTTHLAKPIEATELALVIAGVARHR